MCGRSRLSRAREFHSPTRFAVSAVWMFHAVPFHSAYFSHVLPSSRYEMRGRSSESRAIEGCRPTFGVSTTSWTQMVPVHHECIRLPQEWYAMCGRPALSRARDVKISGHPTARTVSMFQTDPSCQACLRVPLVASS